MKKIYYFCLMAFAMLFGAEASATELEDYSIDWSKQSAYKLWAADDVKPHLTVTADGLQAENSTAIENYKFQYQAASNIGLKAGTDYTMKIVMKGSAEGTMHVAIGDWGKLAEKDINFSTEEKAYTVNFNAAADGGFVLCQSGAFVGTTTIKSITISHEEGSFNGNMFVEYTSKGGKNIWDQQAVYDLPTAMEKDATYTLSMKVKASADLDELAFWPIWNASDNKNEWGGSNDVQYLESKKVTTDWTTLTWTFKASFSHDRLQFCFGKFEGTIDFDDLTLTKEGSTDNLIANGDFATSSLKGWGANWNGPTFEIVKVAGPETAIQCIKSQVGHEEKTYSLSGQRVKKGYKGVVIVNGKKVIWK